MSVYITPGTPMSKVEEFFELNLMAYSHKVVGLFKSIDKHQPSTIPIILVGDFNVDLTLRRLMSYTYGAPILDVSRSHTTTQHSR